MTRLIRWLGLLIIGLFTLVIPTSAQTSSNINLTPPKMDDFPRVMTYLDVRDEPGNFLHGLKASDIWVFEDSRSVPIVNFQEIQPGVQFVVVVNPGDPFTIRNNQGVTRYDFIVEALKSWANSRQGSTIDDMSILITSGPERTHFSDPLKVVSTLDAYQLDEQTLAPSLDGLFRAIEIASDETPRYGMERAIVLITSPLEGDVAFSLQDLISRANQQNIHVFVWLVASPEVATTPDASQLREMASQTGGQFFAFPGDEPLPNLESYLSHLRSKYHLEYDSKLTSGGIHQVEVEIQHGDQRKKSSVVNFEFDLQPPDPAFLSPSLELVREIPGEKFIFPWSQYNSDELAPKGQSLQILIDFPDGRNRPLERTTLYVDGVVVDENVEPPFEYFEWDLSKYTTTGQHLLQVEALDILGLKGASIEIPVQVRVNLPSPNPLIGLVRRWPIIAGLAFLLSGAVLLLVLIMSGRIRPRSLRVPVSFRKGYQTTQQESMRSDQMGGESGGRRMHGWVNRLHWPHRTLVPEAAAYLEYYFDAEETQKLAPIPITADELTIGRDPNQAIVVLDDPSVESLHARLVYAADGSYRITDEGSVGGTWVNYSLVATEGTALEHGDLVHIGRIGLRFTEFEPRRLRKPVITFDES